ncbi:beta-lactamase-like protein [Jimgerdemannia flammicorona]|uniref:Beta-lactamase-like protein n=1 Tax=Jimgerdemannia flammicorona TaxID=994334 RepID=A0A433DGU9_9FUNG|nr:beta-lactamase-like protein [Jimgerdemannia flammicorona]
MKDNAAMGLTVLQLVPGRDIATERSLTSPIQNKIFDYAEVMRNIVYVIADSDSKDCVIVDACWDVDGILSVIRQEGYRVVAALVTHYHFDHVGGAPPPPYDTLPIKVSGLSTLLKRLPHIKAYIHPLDVPYILNANPSIQTSRIIHTCTPTTMSLHLGTRTAIRFIHCPGHTPGSQSMLVNECRLLSGDTLLCGLCGRTDLPGGSKAEMEHTLRHVLGSLDDRIVVMPGHDYGSEWSTIGIERDKGCLGEDLVGYGYGATSAMSIAMMHSHPHTGGAHHLMNSDVKSDTQSVRSSIDTVRSTSTVGSGSGNDRNGSSWSLNMSSTLTTTSSNMSGGKKVCTG